MSCFVTRLMFIALVFVASSELLHATPIGGVVQRLPSVTLDETTQLGMGYALKEGSMRSQSVESGKEEPITANQSTSINYQIDFIENYSDLAKKLDISASGSYGATSARASLMKSSRLTNTEAHVLVRMTVVTSSSQITPPYLLTDLARAALANRETARSRFHGAHGDSFVSAITYGGELLAILHFYDQSAEEKQKLLFSVSGTVGSASLAQSIESLTKDKQVKVNYIQTGGLTGDPSRPAGKDEFSAGGVVTMTQRKLIDRVNQFPREVIDNPTRAKALTGELKDYSVVSNWPTELMAIPVSGRLDPRLSAVYEAELYLKGERERLDSYEAPSKEIAERVRWRSDYVRQAQQRTASIREDILAQSMSQQVATRIETFDQYFAERMLRLASDIDRSNAGHMCDVTDIDLSRLKECMFGDSGTFQQEDWPGITSVKLFRVSTGEKRERHEGTAYSYDHFVDCPPGYPSDFMQRGLERICGASSTNTLVKIESDHFTGRGGHRCGYNAYTVACISINRPQLVDITARDRFARTSLDSSGQFERDLNDSEGRYIYSLTSPCKAAGFGRYEVRFRNSLGRTVRKDGYWRSTQPGTLVLSHVEPEEVPSGSVSFDAGKTYCSVDA